MDVPSVLKLPAVFHVSPGVKRPQQRDGVELDLSCRQRTKMSGMNPTYLKFMCMTVCQCLNVDIHSSLVLQKPENAPEFELGKAV